MEFIFRAAEKFLKDHKRLIRYRRVFAVLAAVVVFATTYELILPAITIDRQRAAETPGMEVGVAAEEAVEESETEDSGEDEAEAVVSVPGEEAVPDASQTQESEESQEEAEVEGEDAAAEESAVWETVENIDDGDSDRANVDESADGTVDETTEDTVDSEEITEPSADAAADTNAAATQEAAATATTEAPAVEYPVTLTYEGDGYTITATFDETANLPAGVSLDALEILPDMIYRDADGNVLYDDYEVYLEKTVETLEKDGRLEDSYVAGARFFDISFIDPEGNNVEPAAPVVIAAQYKKALSAEDTVSTAAVRFEAGKDKTEIYETKQDVKNGAIAEISFKTKKSSVYGIAAAEALETQELTASGDTYEISLSYNQKAEIPEDAKLEAHEMLPGTEEYEECAAKSANTDENGETNSRFFDISIMADGAEFEPKAPVNVRITLKDTAPEEVAADKEITHFTNDGQVENIPQEVEESSDGGAEVSFRMDSFSTVEVPMLGAGNSYSVEVGSSITINGSSSKSHSWSSSNSDVATVSGSGATGTVTGVNAGTATITHTLKKGSETFTVTVTDPYAVDNTEGSLTVTVKENGNSKKLSDYTLVVEQIESTDPYYDEYENRILADTGETTLNFLDMYHIYLQDQNGKEVDLENQNVNLKVTMTFKETPAGWPSENKLKVGHYNFKKNASETISGKDVNNVTVRGNSVSFMIKSFSTITLSAGSTSTTGGGSSVTTQEGSILDGKTFDDANEWQIVSQGYTNNVATNKTNYGNDSYQAVRVQKNIIPTGVENEFLVYMSVDTKSLMKEYLTYAQYQATTSNNYHSAQLGQVVDHMTGNEKVQVSASEKLKKGPAYFTIYASDKKTILAKDVPLWWSQAENVTFDMKLSNGKYILMGLEIKSGQHEEVMLSAEAEKLIKEEVMKVIDLNQVTDKMGDNIEFLEIVDGDYNSAPTCGDGVLTWQPVMKNSPKTETTGSGDAITTWNLNVAELVYKVRLRVKDNGFNSCANNMNSSTSDKESYPVNQNASIKYSVSIGGTTQSNKTATFQKPYVRGLLYDVAGKKVDENGNLLKDAEFSLTGTDVYDSPISETITSSETAYNAAGGSNLYYIGLAAAIDSASYVLKETKAPSGYKLDTSEKTAYLNYTNNKTNLIASSLDSTHMMVNNSPSAYTYTNIPTEIKVTKVWTDAAEKDHSGDSATITITASNNASISDSVQVLNAANNWAYTWKKLPQYDGDTKITYSITENTVTGYSTIVTNPSNEELSAFYAGTGDLSYTVTNTPVKYKVVLTKVGQDGLTLTGATLNMGSIDVSNVTTAGTADLGTNVALNTEYTVSETKAPAGYDLLLLPIKFKIVEDSSVIGGYKLEYIGGDDNTNKKLSLSVTEATEKNPVVTLNLALSNDAGAVLPETGGTGFLSPQTLCGIMAMAFVLATAVMYGFSMRRGERRYK